jgi:hypothetical protein
MRFFGTDFDDITAENITDVVSNRTPERRNLEYKVILPGNPDADKKEFLADVSSFANSYGGHIIYGVSETDSPDTPYEVVGLDIDDSDTEVARLDSIIRDGITPRIPGIAVRHIPSDDHGGFVIIQIPSSFVRPHMVSFKHNSRFYARHSNGKYQLDHNEIGSAFLLAGSASDRAHRFRLDRLGLIADRRTPIPLADGPAIVLHVVPMSSLTGPSSFDLNDFSSASPNLRPLNSHGWDHRMNIDGKVLHNRTRGAAVATSYLQLFRNGVIEFAECGMINSDGTKYRIPTLTFEESIITGVDGCLLGFRGSSVTPPCAIMISLLGVKGAELGVSNRPLFIDTPREFDRDEILVPDTLVSDFTVAADEALKAPLDMVWNAAGWHGSENYDENGVRIRRG